MPTSTATAATSAAGLAAQRSACPAARGHGGAAGHLACRDVVRRSRSAQASRDHLASLLRDHHLPLPDADATHLRLDVGAFRIRWELHTEFVTWTFVLVQPGGRLDGRAPADRHRGGAARLAGRRCPAARWRACTCGSCRPKARVPTDAGARAAAGGDPGGVHRGGRGWRAVHRFRDPCRRFLAHVAADRRHCAAPAGPAGAAPAGDRDLPHGGPAGTAGGARCVGGAGHGRARTGRTGRVDPHGHAPRRAAAARPT